MREMSGTEMGSALFDEVLTLRRENGRLQTDRIICAVAGFVFGMAFLYAVLFAARVYIDSL
jgi:hypothetical protein